MLRKVVELFSSPTRSAEPRTSQPPQGTPSPRPTSSHSTSSSIHSISDSEEATQFLLDQQLNATEPTPSSADAPTLTLPSGDLIHFTEVLAYIKANPNTPKIQRAQLVDFSKTQIAKIATGLEGLAASIKDYDEKEELYKCLNMTKEDSEAKHAVFHAMAGRGARSQKDIELAIKRLNGLAGERSKAVAEIVKNDEKWKNNVTGTKAFARFLNTAPNGLVACWALNTAIIERFERIENKQQGGVRFPGPTTADFKRATELLKGPPLPCRRPSCKLSLLRKYGMQMLPEGICGEWKTGEPHSTTSSWFEGEKKKEDGQYTLQIVNDVPNHNRETRATAATPLRQAYEAPIEISGGEESDEEVAGWEPEEETELPATPSKKKKKAPRPVSPKKKRKAPLPAVKEKVVIKQEPKSPHDKKQRRA